MSFMPEILEFNFLFCVVIALLLWGSTFFLIARLQNERRLMRGTLIRYHQLRLKLENLSKLPEQSMEWIKAYEAVQHEVARQMPISQGDLF